MEKQDYLDTWGYLNILISLLEQKARDAAASGGDDNEQLAVRYLMQCSDIRALQEKIGEEVVGLP